ncbi:IS1595 family transposase [Paenibacillus filicis]|uniref:IS1595 family transposase n=1 Tax=Paenibacillus gyeongsangnamensis TaxID=3388067 RepID=A0ABT4QBZ5_9BACL|nr:IS1595 family transposase [Paenibacillus filicis]MCZ8514349.1 IS1595 family transposase [Paenibacillus filicis]
MAKAESLSLLDFLKYFGTEENCAEYIMSKRWKDGFSCLKCNHTEYYYIRTRQLYECRKCHYQASITAGTLFHKTKQPLTVWFWAIYLVAHDKRGKSALSLSDVLGLNYRTAFNMLRKIRAAMKDRDSGYMLSGVVEMDDAYFGAPRKGKDGRGSDKSKAVIALSKDAQNHPEFLKIETINGVTIEEIERVAKKHIQPGSMIVSDGHRSYKRLMEVGFVHEAKAYYKEDKDDFLKMLHIIIGNVKAYIQGTYHGLGSTYLQSYFDEFCFRFNRRFNPKEIFDNWIKREGVHSICFW